MNSALTSLLERELHLKVQAARAVSGGCISDAYAVNTNSGSLFVKAGPASAADMFEAEAAGLLELARAEAIRVPDVIGTGCNEYAAFIALEWLDCRPATAATDARLGEQLARLHAMTTEQFGWTRDNFIGSTPQPNPRADNWLTFWRDARIAVQLAHARQKGAPKSLLDKGERLLAELPALLAGDAPAPSLLHGDLWSGNRASDERGQPVIFDPAVYYGDRETDLAMMKLFGGFNADCYRHYQATWPLPDGHEHRIELYQLYHVLNHFNLFGSSYGSQADRMMDRLLERC